MNFLVRLAERLRLVWAAARGFETGVVAPLPDPLVDPNRSAAELIAAAEQQGALDAQAFTVDGWSFGPPDAPESDLWDPSYVRRLREEREAALATIGQYQSITTSRVSHVRRWRDETEDMMSSARTMMTGIAVREARMEELTTRRSQARAGVDVTAEDLPNVQPDDLQWEGETNPLAAVWRVLIIAGLIAAELPVQYFVYDYYLAGLAGGTMIGSLSLSSAVFMVLGPHLAGLLLRSRQATGAERRIGPAVIALAVPWLFVAAALGVVRGAILNVDPTRTGRLHITPLTVVLMFVALMLIIGAMSFMLGLARRHPFQEAYVRQRNRRDRLDTLRRGMAERINPAFRDSAELGAALFEQDERAIRSAYAAAEEAYFTGLVRAVGDPVFTEAVQRRRGLRPTRTDPPPPRPADIRPATADPVPAGAAAAAGPDGGLPG